MTAGMQRSTDALTRLALSHDASRFLEIPEEVAVASCLDDVRALFAEAVEGRKHLTLRGGGTSLSGQSVTDGILVDVRRNFRDIEVLDDGLRVRAGAGATVAAVNARLRRHGRRLGPDPASAQGATVGGIIANNARGRLSSQHEDAFSTVESLVVVLPNGRVIDTADPRADVSLAWEDPHLAGGLSILRRRLRDDEQSLDEIRRLWSMRNSMGYQLRALTDYAKPSTMIRQLMIGSEGTLGFIAEATFKTVPLRESHSIHMALFDSGTEAVQAAASLAGQGFDAIEFFDADAIRVLREIPSSPDYLRGFELEDQAALLLELHASSAQELAEREERVVDVLAEFAQLHRVQPTKPVAPLWRVHHGIHTAMAMARKPGTSLLIEDFAVPVGEIAGAIQDLNKLFDRFGFDRAPITGHLTDGTLYFLLIEDFSDAARLRKFKRFVQGFVRMVLARKGVLRAQYGTGRVMAPFLEQQVGTELFECMREIKHLFDPMRILSPEVMFNENPDAHVSHIKLMPTISDSVDRCIECGLCEPTCPSSALTLTPRQRIVLQREIAARHSDTETLRALSDNYQYAAIDSCATSGMCALSCPLGIDTGELVRRQRRANVGEVEERNWDRAARNWDQSTRLASTAMSAAKHLGPVAASLLKLGRRHFGSDQIWGYSTDLPSGGSLRRRPKRERIAKDAVALYFPGCQQTMLASPGEGVYAAFNELCTRAGVAVSLFNASDLCCGLPWTTRGMTLGHQTMAGHVHRALAPRADETVVVDSSACAGALDALLSPYPHTRPEVVDVVDFVATTILPRLTVTHRLGALLLYPTCANAHSHNDESLMAIAEAMAREVVIPDEWRCCGGHGERGLLHPELPQAATRLAVEEILARDFDGYASTTRTCEVAMSRVSGKPFVHLLELLAQATR